MTMSMVEAETRTCGIWIWRVRWVGVWVSVNRGVIGMMMDDG